MAEKTAKELAREIMIWAVQKAGVGTMKTSDGKITHLCPNPDCKRWEKEFGEHDQNCYWLALFGIIEPILVEEEKKPEILPGHTMCQNCDDGAHALCQGINNGACWCIVNKAHELRKV